jgi:peroxin-3
VRQPVLPPTNTDTPRTCKWLIYLLPPQDQEEYVLGESGMAPSEATSPTTTASLRRLIDETSDLVDSPSFTHVLTRLLDAAFSHLIDIKISQLSYKIPPISESTARVQEIVGSDVKAKVASSLAVFCRQAHSIGSGANNEYLAAVESVGELEAFAAVVYSSNFDFESPEAATVSRPTTAITESKKTSLAVSDDSLIAGFTQPDSVKESWVGGDAGLESAWEKALAKEDGRTE